MSSLGIIPIRYESERLPGKTFKMVANKPLIEWTLEVARRSDLTDIIVVSSSEEVRAYCDDKHVAMAIRPRGLESSEAQIIDTIMWLNENHMNSVYDIQMLLQITNPTRTVNDIDTCLQCFECNHINSVCSFVNVGEWHPNRMYEWHLGNVMVPFRRGHEWGNTQALTPLYLRDGSIYAWRTQRLLKEYGRTLLPEQILGYEIPVTRSVRIDTEKDLRLAESLLTLPVGHL